MLCTVIKQAPTPHFSDDKFVKKFVTPIYSSKYGSFQSNVAKNPINATENA